MSQSCSPPPLTQTVGRHPFCQKGSKNGNEFFLAFSCLHSSRFAQYLCKPDYWLAWCVFLCHALVVLCVYRWRGGFAGSGVLSPFCWLTKRAGGYQKVQLSFTNLDWFLILNIILFPAMFGGVSDLFMLMLV